MFRFVCSFFGLSIYSVLVYIGARIAQLLDHLDDGRWHSNVMKYIEPWQFAAGFVLHTAFTVWRGFAAGRIPLANQFEFASGFAWSAAVMALCCM